MYSQDPDIRRRRVKLRFFAYGLMTLATVGFAAAGMLYVLGYRIDNTFEVQRGGLLKFDTRPQNARITMDNKEIETTPHQLNSATGDHTISYSKDGYQGWQKKVTLHPGEVLWLNYARLIPTTIETAAIKPFASMHQTSSAPNREWFMVHAKADSPEFTLVDVRTENNIKDKQIALPTAVFTAGKVHKFSIEAWSANSEYILVRHVYDKKTEFIRMPRDNPANSQNLNNVFNLPLSEAEFASNTENVLYAKDTAQTLYRLDIANAKNPLKVAEAVASFDNLDAAQVAYVAKPAQAQPAVTQALHIWQENNKVTQLQTVAKGVKAHVQYNPYLAHDYITLVSENSMSVVQDPLDANKTLVNQTIGFTPTSLAASPGNRYFVTQHAAKLHVYDVELRRSYMFDAPGQQTQPVQWADDHHMTLNGGNNLRLIEFDGANSQQITSVVGAYDVILGADGEVLLSIGKSAANKIELQRSYLQTEADRNSLF